MMADMSTSLKVVSMAAVRWASSRRSAITWRRRDMRIRVSRRSPTASKEDRSLATAELPATEDGAAGGAGGPDPSEVPPPVGEIAEDDEAVEGTAAREPPGSGSVGAAPGGGAAGGAEPSEVPLPLGGNPGDD